MHAPASKLGACLAYAGLALLMILAPRLAAHEVPADITVRVIVKPEGERLVVAVRAPLEAMRDIEFPTLGPGYLDISNAEPALTNAALLWLAGALELAADGTPLGRPTLVAARASIPSDRSFTSYAEAAAHVRSPPLPADTQLVWRQALLDALFELQLDSDEALSLRPAFERLGLKVTTVIRFESGDGRVRLYQVEGTSGRIELDPRWHSAAVRFVEHGFRHILDGADHLLFLFCLVLPFHGRFRELVLIVTAFTVAHSVTLIGSAYGIAPDALWFTPLVETAIAASIFYMALENIIAPNVRMRWAFAFAFGLVHGFGFSFVLRDTLQFAGDHVLLSLLAFNIGVELGQLLVLVVLVPVLHVVLRRAAVERTAVLVLSVIIAHTAWHWTAERFEVFRAYPLPWPSAVAAVRPSNNEEIANVC
jgi:hypothetical protein